MYKERQEAGLDAGIETYRNYEFEHIGLQFRRPDLDNDKGLFPEFNVPISSGYVFGPVNLPGFSDSWNPLQIEHPPIHESRTYPSSDVYPLIKRPNTWPRVYSDSGYGSQYNGDTRSSMSLPSSLDTRTEVSPDDCHTYIKSVTEPRQPRTESIEENQLRCTQCPWTGKLPSEMRKHLARHRKSHLCEENHCGRRFGSLNDLERHRKSVHNKSPQCGPKEMYKCFGRNCRHPEKEWPRLDNFKAHLRRQHDDQNVEDLVSQSRLWYEKRKIEEEEKKEKLITEGPASGIEVTPRKEATQSNVDTLKTPSPLDNDDSLKTITPFKMLLSSGPHNSGDYFDGRLKDLTLNPIGHSQSFPGNISPENLQTPNDSFPSTLKTGSSSPVQADMKLPSLPDVLGDISSQGRNDLVFRKRPESTPEKRTLPGVESFDPGVMSEKAFAIAAKLQNEMHCLSHEERKVIASIINLEKTQERSKEEDSFSKRVDTREEPSQSAKVVSKKEGFTCQTCQKSFSRPSTLRKHQKRHEKPYGCTFTGCYSSFGSKSDWKRHESMQHCHTQSFRCSLPRDKHDECARVFLREQEFLKHLDIVHHGPGRMKKLQQLADGRIGANDAESKFTYWCGFCKVIKIVEKTGVEALKERFDHIDSHFQKGGNIKRWVPAKGHTEKGAQKKRDKSRTKESKRTITNLEEDSQRLYDNGHDDWELSTYEQCPSSEDETFTEVEPRAESYSIKNKFQKSESNQTAKELRIVHCVSDDQL
ncbi:C2H2 finger domain protein, putative [Talaromyces stipitatus ATCC 10500]|uniref:pH-response transcription factor pacC/RIM101 n=1 Tax=Talaromyces stipitatus (strain ATCC 10500 / CBS 375.48 / QM 6759 / NRRL 1006) TaxID=441959 RepID=B8MDW6_TALSN|nr:C2H2 finger domain protein, putative [Talaromyces stipitatus ATCC 10500]EED16042.1 C2H2 finger domain protein, putative [Talaromyces stipitatus ATCC 10500]